MKRITFTFLFFISLNAVFACSCFGPQTFCGFVFDNFQEPDLIVKGKKTGEFEHGMDFEISLVIDGDESKETIRIWGDVGHLCRKYVSGFEEEVEYLLALHKIEPHIGFPTGWSSLETEEHYSISVCGKSYWSCEDENEESIEEIQRCFGKSLNLCGKSSTNEKKYCPVLKTEIYPNPASNFCNIDLVDNTTLQTGSAIIFDICGKQVARFENLSEFHSQDQLSFDLKNLESGLYFLDLNLPNICTSNVTRQLMVNK